jgi:hypothetical protein
MAKRLAVTVLLAPATIYQHAAVSSEGYAPAADARFAVVRAAGRSDGPWVLVHRRSGMLVESLLPPRKFSRTDKLAVAAAFHACTHLDWTPFDAIPQVSEGDLKGPGFAPEHRDAAGRIATELRIIASSILGA